MWFIIQCGELFLFYICFCFLIKSPTNLAQNIIGCQLQSLDLSELNQRMLPTPWEPRRSATTGRTYFFNPVTGVSQYKAPLQPIVGPDQHARHPKASPEVYGCALISPTNPTTVPTCPFISSRQPHLTASRNLEVENNSNFFALHMLFHPPTPQVCWHGDAFQQNVPAACKRNRGA